MDSEATSVDQANALGLARVTSIISQLQLPATHKKYIEGIIGVIGPNKNLYTTQSSAYGPVVEVNTVYTGGGHAKYTLQTMLDVDIPPPHSTQKPHFGFEVKLNGLRVGNGHIWLPVGALKASRPAPGTPLETYGYNTTDLVESHPLPKGLSFEASFRRYKL